VGAEKIGMQRLFLDVVQLRGDLPVSLVKGMWDDMFGPQVRVTGNSHYLHHRRNLTAKASIAHKIKRAQWSLLQQNSDLEVKKSEITSYNKPNTDSAQIYGLTTMGETRKSLAARTKSVSSKTPNTQPSSLAKLNQTAK
jgi:hypothetical protein